MDEKRKGEIACALLKYKVSKEGTPLSRTALQDAVKKLTAETQIPISELYEFLEILMRDLFEATFPGRIKVPK